MLVALLLVVTGGARDAGVKVDPWAFEGLSARVSAKGAARDALSSAALQQLGVRLEGALTLSVSASANTVGGVTLRVADPGDAKAYCDLYAQRDGDELRFVDNRCSFPAFSGRLRTTATCRKLSGVARRTAEAGRIDLEVSSPDCTAQPLGLSVTLTASLSPWREGKSG